MKVQRLDEIVQLITFLHRPWPQPFLYKVSSVVEMALGLDQG